MTGAKVSLGSFELPRENEKVPTAISLSDRVEIELLTADEFLDWLKPEVHAHFSVVNKSLE